MKLSHISIFSALLALAACSKDDRLLYQEDARVYFTKNVVNADSTDYSFAFRTDDVQYDTVWLNFRIMGSAAAKDRVIGVRVSDTSRAKAGYHYRIGDKVMPANEYQTRVPVILYRRPGLKDSILTIDFAVEESADFKPGYNDKPNGALIDRLHYKISITDQLLKPSRWDQSLAGSFGVYSLVKFRFMIRVTGKTDWNSTIYPGDQQFLIQTVKYELYLYEQANGPLIDENGQRVVFP